MSEGGGLSQSWQCQGSYDDGNDDNDGNDDDDDSDIADEDGDMETGLKLPFRQDCNYNVCRSHVSRLN